MLLSISKSALNDLVLKQLYNLLVANLSLDSKLQLSKAIDESLERVEYCFSYIRNKYFHKGRHIYFDVYHTDQYAMFLYFLSNTIYKKFNNTQLATKIYYLNKVLHSIDVYFEVELPQIFMFGHPVGTVLGRAKYSNYFVVSQHCTVGNNKGIYPVLEEGVVLYMGASVLGNSNIGKNSCISANTLVKDQNVPGNSIVFGTSPFLTFKQCKFSVVEKYFNVKV